MPTKKKTDPAMEEKLDGNIEEVTEEKVEEKIRSEDILTVDARDVIETDEDQVHSGGGSFHGIHSAGENPV